jgi:hypothetical protein
MKACVSTAMPLCRWPGKRVDCAEPFDCFPCHRLGNFGLADVESLCDRLRLQSLQFLVRPSPRIDRR